MFICSVEDMAGFSVVVVWLVCFGVFRKTFILIQSKETLGPRENSRKADIREQQKI